MNEEDKDILKQAYLIATKTEDEFFNFFVNTKVQLMVTQLQFFQSLGAISLAFVAIALGTKLATPNLWWFLAGVFSLLLLVYISTNIRETIDSESKSLEDTEKILKKNREEIRTVIDEAFSKNDFSIYEKYLERNENNQEPVLMSYAGEIAMFLFINILFFGLIAVLSLYHTIFSDIKFQVIGTIFGIGISLIVSFVDWNIKATNIISTKLSGINTIIKNKQM